MTEGTLWIPAVIYEQLMFYTINVKEEVGGLGIVSIAENGNATIEELFLLEQDVEPSECTLSPIGIAKLFTELKNTGQEEKIGEINLWWHSHAKMKAFFSGTDNKTMEEWTGDHLFAIVINHSQDMVAKIMTRNPMYIVSDIDVIVDWCDVPEAKAWTEEIKEKVKKKVFAPAAKKPEEKEQKTFYPVPQNWEMYDDDEDELWKKYCHGSIHDLTEEEFEKLEEMEAAEIAGFHLIPLEDIEEWEKEAIRYHF